jgi:dsRNA-specific ribonuclease
MSDDEFNETDIKHMINDGELQRQDGELVFNPYNQNNHEITVREIEDILRKYGVRGKIHNIHLYQRAFIHKSYVKRPQLENQANGIQIVEKPANCMPLKTKHNERLEFVGDGVLECITKYYLYRRFPKENEGFMTEKKIAIVKNEAIGRIAYEMGLHKWYIISNHAEEKKIRTNLKKLGCLFEAFIGALFLDFNKMTISDEEKWFEGLFKTGPGFQMAQVFIENVFEQHIDWVALINRDDNYKNILQVKVQKEFKLTPTYLEINKTDEDGYHMGVYVCLGMPDYTVNHADSVSYADLGGTFEGIQEYFKTNDKCLVFLGDGIHKIKKKAEQMACMKALNLKN